LGAKHPAIKKELHPEADAALRAFDGWRMRSVPRPQNAGADGFVNEALDGGACRITRGMRCCEKAARRRSIVMI
jgi:hypothetical protein